MNPFRIIQPTARVTNCPRSETCGWTWQPILANVPLAVKQ